MELKEEKIIQKENYLLYFMSQPEIKTLKEKIWLKNNKKCPILNKEYPLDDMVLDHKHKLKSQDPDKDLGAVREALHRSSNALAGKIENNFKRYFGSDESKHPCTLPEFLRNMADYLEKGSYSEKLDNQDKEIYFTHPTEVPKRKKVSKRDMNLIKKWYFIIKSRAKKLPKFTYITEEYLDLLNKAKSLNDEFGTLKKYNRYQKSLKN